MDNNFEEKLKKGRSNIDKIDKALVELLNKRAVTVLKIKRLKEKNNMSLYDAKREEDLMDNIIKYNKGPLYNDNIVQIFEAILRNVQILEKDESL
ncbi:MAG: chorismate mutase [Actinobacteria bacterium]|nr:chorismate mutase [Actinomycetota bacterium]MBL7060758.1 chorismate mutase [Actinomycetota bacterium]